jgi:DNA-directed RNA polymerase subunit RPC12/RpoP
MIDDLDCELAALEARLADVQRRIAARAPGYYTDAAYLCAECGTISRASAWTPVRWADDEPRVIIDETGESETLRCPACLHDHRDDDSGAGMYGDTVGQCLGERARLLAERTEQHAVDWQDVWLDRWDARGAEVRLALVRAELRREEAPDGA